MKKAIGILLGVFLMFSITACTDDTGKSENVEGANVEFYVTADKTEIKGDTDRVTITVKATAKNDLHIILGTGSYKEKGAVDIQCYMVQKDVEYLLYNDLFGRGGTDDEYEFDFKKGDTITRTLKFSRFPVQEANETTKIMPKGEYKVRVKLDSESTWTETDIVINAQ